MLGLSLVVKTVGYGLIAVHISNCGGFSYFGAWALEHSLSSCGAWA